MATGELTKVIPENWRDTLTPPKEVRSEMTEELFDKVIMMRDELIDDQRKEISKLKMKVNKLQQRIDKYYQV